MVEFGEVERSPGRRRECRALGHREPSNIRQKDFAIRAAPKCGRSLTRQYGANLRNPSGGKIKLENFRFGKQLGILRFLMVYFMPPQTGYTSVAQLAFLGGN
jgi:hypothetical protein